MAALRRPAPTVCRYCGEPAHVPADACLSAARKVGRVVGVTLAYVLGIVVLIGLVVWLASATEPEEAPRDVVCTGGGGNVVCEYR